MKYFLIICALLILTSTTHAEIFRNVDSNGNITFSDQPNDESKKVELSPINSQPFPKGRAVPTKKQEAANPYTSLNITSPGNDTTIPTGQMTVPVNVSVMPKLRAGHLIQLFLNGNIHGSPASPTALKLTGLHRGEHSISAAVIDKKGKAVINSNTVTIHVKRASVN